MTAPGSRALDLFDPLPPAAPFRLVLPRAKQERLAGKVRVLSQRPGCRVDGCVEEGLAVVLVDSEAEAVLCPRHLLVLHDGTPVEGQPTFVTAAW